MTALIVLCVVLAVALVCVCLAAYDLVTQACEDLDDARAENQFLRERLAEKPAAANVVPFRSDAKDRVAGRIATNQAKRTDWTDAFRPIGQDGA